MSDNPQTRCVPTPDQIDRSCTVTNSITDEQQPLTTRPTETAVSEVARAIPVIDLTVAGSPIRAAHTLVGAAIDGCVPLALTAGTGTAVEPAHEHLQAVVRDGVGDPVLTVTVAGEHDGRDDTSSPHIIVDTSFDFDGRGTIVADRRRAINPANLGDAVAHIEWALDRTWEFLADNDRFIGPILAHVETVDHSDSPLTSPVVEARGRQSQPPTLDANREHRW